MAAPRGTRTGRTSKGRRPIKIAFIEDPSSRMVTFSKRKSGLLKKASELSLLCGASVAAIVFSQAGRPFEFGNPSVGHVLRRFAPLAAGAEDGRLGVGFPGDGIDDRRHREAVEATSRRLKETRERVAGEKARMHAVGEKVLRAAAGRFWWEADVEALGVEELPEFARALHRLRDEVRRRADKLPAGPCLAADDAAAVEPSAAAPRCVL